MSDPELIMVGKTFCETHNKVEPVYQCVGCKARYKMHKDYKPRCPACIARSVLRPEYLP